MKKWTVAVVGATGAVGREILAILEERAFPVAALRLFASPRSAGQRLPFAGEAIPVEAATPEGLAGVDIAFFSAGAGVSRELAPLAADAGALVVDNSSAFRLEPGVPLVVPEINGGELHPGVRLVANPNCTTAILLMALAPLHRAAGLRRVVVATYQAVSGAGARAMEELREQVRAWLEGRQAEARVLPSAAAPRHYPIAFNVLPQVDVFLPGGGTKEEWKVAAEARKILNEPDLPVTATCVRVPVFRAHAEAVYAEFGRALSAEEARAILARAPGVVVQDDPDRQEYPTPLSVSGRDPVFVGRIRQDPAFPNALSLWVVGDQLRKGAALNAVQIAEAVVGNGRP